MLHTRTYASPAIIAALALSLAACSGGGSIPSPGPATPVPAASGTAKMTIKIPAGANGTSLHRAYVSASTKSMTIGLQSGSTTKPLGEADLTATSPNCAAASGGGTQCNVSVTAPVGTNTLVLKMYDQLGGKGNLLSTGNVSVTIAEGQNATVPVALDGVATSVALVLGTSTLPVGSAGSTSVTVQAKDSGGNIIVGPDAFSTPITLAITGDTYKTLALSASQVSSPAQVVTLSYNGGSNVGSAITPSIGGTAGTAAQFSATGAVLTDFVWQDTLDNVNHTYPYGVAALPNGQAAMVLQMNGPTTLYGIGVASPTAMQKVYIGDTSDPFNPPAAGSLTYQGMTVVHGMSSNIVSWNGEDVSKQVASSSTGTFYYAASFATASDPACAGGTENSGVIGAFNPNGGTTKETLLKGIPEYIQVDSSGNVWFVEETGNCSTSGNYFPSGYAIGELSASGSLVKEVDFATAGIPSISPNSMALSPDGTKMYIAENGAGIVQLILPGVTVGATETLTNSTYPLAMAAGSDGSLAWFSDNDPGYNYYYGSLPSNATFGTTAASEALFPVQYFYSYGMTYADGSYWIAGNEYGTGFGRLSNMTGTPVPSYYALPYPDGDGQELTGIAAGGGYVWAGDYEYGNIDVMQYGAPSNGTVTYNSVHRTAATALRKNTVRQPHYGFARQRSTMHTHR